MDKHTPGTRMAQARRLLTSHQAQLTATGVAAYIVHRHEIGRPTNFLLSLRRVLPSTATAEWYPSPWPRGAQRNVLVVTMPGSSGGELAEYS